MTSPEQDEEVVNHVANLFRGNQKNPTKISMHMLQLTFQYDDSNGTKVQFDAGPILDKCP